MYQNSTEAAPDDKGGLEPSERLYTETAPTLPGDARELPAAQLGLLVEAYDLFAADQFKRAAVLGLVPESQRVSFEAQCNDFRGSVHAEANFRLAQLKAKKEAEDRFQQEEALRNGVTGTWGRIDPLKALEAASSLRIPEVGRFTRCGDEPDHGVFYLGCLNEVHGESESGKSLFVLHVVAQELIAGHGVVYVDYESDEGDVYARLQNLMGVEQNVLAGDLFRYHRPNGPMTPIEQAQFMKSVGLGGSMAVFDGVTEGMSLEGLDGRLEKDVARWHAKTTKWLTHNGWCVAAIDHTPHDATRTLGSQHKRAAIGGVSYLVEQVHQVGTGQRGVLRLSVDKDRPGSVRREAAPGKRPQWRGDLVIDWTTGRVRPDIALFPTSKVESGDKGYEAPPEKVCRAVLEYVGAHPESSGKTDIRDAVRGRAAMIGRCVDWLAEKGFLERRGNGKNVQYVATDKPFDQERQG
ncbi:hypothetical protein [Streptomyces cupreus]|uniref:AAA family ATPase n=1 Tax=Streptomyces cupreus TaxID=2759956 RepID=A0A7X1JAZ1_9ACTN|nr:hypothetical protein [Streptomyces cupreus]MBC2904932.1 hypothetical protein [Streptomyces cupreus]